MNIKKPAVAGMFYPQDTQELQNLILSYYQNIFLEETKIIPKALVLPHAGYVYSGSIAMYGYKLLVESQITPNTFVIMGPSHRKYFSGVEIGGFDAYETPCGLVENNLELANKIVNQFPNNFYLNNDYHSGEHCLEVQLPFLQVLFSQHKFNIITLLYGDTDPIEIGSILSEILDFKKVILLISTDLSHFHPYNIAVQKDQQTISCFLNGDGYDDHSHNQACGIGPRLSLTHIAKKFQRNNKLLKYANSGDTAGNKSEVVGYASIAYY